MKYLSVPPQAVGLDLDPAVNAACKAYLAANSPGYAQWTTLSVVAFAAVAAFGAFIAGRASVIR